MSLVNYLIEVCKILGLLALSMFLFSIIIAIIKTGIENIKKRKVKKKFEEEVAPQIEKAILEAIEGLNKEENKPKKNYKKDYKKR